MVKRIVCASAAKKTKYKYRFFSIPVLGRVGWLQTFLLTERSVLDVQLVSERLEGLVEKGMERVCNNVSSDHGSLKKDLPCLSARAAIMARRASILNDARSASLEHIQFTRYSPRRSSGLSCMSELTRLEMIAATPPILNLPSVSDASSLAFSDRYVRME